MRPGKQRSERGANLVEFAVLAPLLIALLLGIVDFGWFLGQYQDVRHGAREAARLAAVNTDTEANMTALVQNATNIAGSVTVTFTDGSTGCAGSTGNVSVTAPATSLTGFSSLPFFSAIYPSSFTSQVDFRLERDSTNWGANSCP